MSLVIGQRLEVREIESQPVRCDERPGLTHVRAKTLAERRVEQVSGRVIAPRRVARAPRRRCAVSLVPA